MASAAVRALRQAFDRRPEPAVDPPAGDPVQPLAAQPFAAQSWAAPSPALRPGAASAVAPRPVTGNGAASVAVRPAGHSRAIERSGAPPRPDRSALRAPAM